MWCFFLSCAIRWSVVESKCSGSKVVLRRRDFVWSATWQLHAKAGATSYWNINTVVTLSWKSSVLQLLRDVWRFVGKCPTASQDDSGYRRIPGRKRGDKFHLKQLRLVSSAWNQFLTVHHYHVSFCSGQTLPGPTEWGSSACHVCFGQDRKKIIYLPFLNTF